MNLLFLTNLINNISIICNMNRKQITSSLIIILLIVSVISIIFIAFTWSEEKKTIELGDCVEIHFIGRYASNNTIFQSSYDDTGSKSGGTPLKVFMSLDRNEMPPEGYELYSSGLIEGLLEGLIGLEEGEQATIGPIPPEKAYGFYPEIGDAINITDIPTGIEIQIQFVNILPTRIRRSN